MVVVKAANIYRSVTTVPLDRLKSNYRITSGIWNNLTRKDDGFTLTAGAFPSSALYRQSKFFALIYGYRSRTQILI
jgi:hypothetical protein